VNNKGEDEEQEYPHDDVPFKRKTCKTAISRAIAAELRTPQQPLQTALSDERLAKLRLKPTSENPAGVKL
jgi:hypothetical protein